jgi:hypothetical protein
MQFGSVEGYISESVERENPVTKLTVVLETSQRISTVRDEVLHPGLIEALGGDLHWIADQLTQETIANELAVQGWEAIGEGEAPSKGSLPPHSARYVVRRI